MSALLFSSLLYCDSDQIRSIHRSFHGTNEQQHEKKEQNEMKRMNRMKSEQQTFRCYSYSSFWNTHSGLRFDSSLCSVLWSVAVSFHFVSGRIWPSVPPNHWILVPLTNFHTNILPTSTLPTAFHNLHKN